MVFYRKYRPQKISELDLVNVSETLANMLKSDSIPHAFLFTGSKGLGKTSSARILAKAINCKNKKEIEPCNNCNICKSITNGSHVDVLEIDAASNGGVEEIRSLRENVKFSSNELEKKVYIIDEVHMLSAGAFNALLKTLEEPPSHVIFVLCTTETWKLPPTVISRTFQIEFRKPTVEELSKSLKRISLGEHLDVPEAVYSLIYSVSEGSFRDAAKILEELSLQAKDKKITTDLFEKHFKLKNVDVFIEELLKKLSEKKLKESIQIIEDMSDLGIDSKIIIEKTADILHSLLLEKVGAKPTAQSLDFEISDIKRLLELLEEAYENVRYAVIRQLPLELLCISWCLDNATIQNGQSIGVSKSKIELKSESSLSDASVVDKSTKVKVHKNKLLIDLIKLVNAENKQIAAVLRGCASAEEKNGTLYLEAPFDFHVKKLNEEKSLEIIELKAKELLGDKIKVDISISSS